MVKTERTCCQDKEILRHAAQLRDRILTCWLKEKNISRITNVYGLWNMNYYPWYNINIKEESNVEKGLDKA